MKTIFALLIAGLVGGTVASAAEPKPFTKHVVLLCQKPDGHPKGTHEYLRGQQILKDILVQYRDRGLYVTYEQADDPWTDGPEQLAEVDGVVLFVSQGAKWISADPRRYEAFAKLAARGGGLSVIHWGCGTKDAADVEPFTRLFGACHGGPDRKYKFTDFSVSLPTPEHPICSGVKPLKLNEEFYFALKRSTLPGSKLTPLAEITLDEATTPESRMVSWAYERPDGGRSFGFTGLHYHKNWQREEFRRLVAQGVAWTLKLEIPKQGLDTTFAEELLEP